jgi:hypothetical protein
MVRMINRYWLELNRSVPALEFVCVAHRHKTGSDRLAPTE